MSNLQRRLLKRETDPERLNEIEANQKFARDRKIEQADGDQDVIDSANEVFAEILKSLNERRRELGILQDVEADALTEAGRKVAEG